MYTNADITLYNAYYDATTRLNKWKRTHIKGVFWVNRKGANKIKSGMDACDSVQVFIPLTVSGYVEPKSFDGSVGWTLRTNDKIVLGIVDDEIKDLEKKYDNVHDITSVDLKDYGSMSMRHWEIGGR